MAGRATKSYKNEAFGISLALHGILILLFLYILITPPNPPLSQSSFGGGGGVVLNIGDIYAGTGDPTNLSPTEVSASENAEANPTEDIAAESSSEPEVSEESEVTDPDAVEIEKEKEQPKEKPKTDNKVADKTDNKNNTKNTNSNNTQQKVDSKNLFPGSTKKAGDNNNTSGDPGNPNGVDPNSLYAKGKNGEGGGEEGGTGTGKGPSVGGGIAGWKYSGNALPVDNSQEKGTLVFTILVGDDGTVMNVKTKTNTGISPKVEKLYRDQVYKLTFDPVGKVPPVTEGTLTYKLDVK